MTLSIISTLQWLNTIINEWIGLIIFIFGITGNLFNLIIFTRRMFFKQSCSLYLVATSINNLAIFFAGLSTRILDEGFHIEIFDNNSNIYCKIRTYFVYVLFAISSWFFVFASLDRFYSTNQSTLKRQQFCSTSMVLKFISLTIIGCLLAHIHIIIYYENVYTLNPYNILSLTCGTNNNLTSSENLIKTDLTREYESFSLTIVRLLLYMNYGSSFYIQIIISKTFRDQFFKIIANIKRYFKNFY